MVNWKQSLQEISLVLCRLLLSCCFLFSKSNLYLSLYVHFINRLVLRVRISWNSWFYFLFYMICMSLDMISISQRAIHFHPFISIKANGTLLTIANNLEPWLFDQISLRFKLEALYSENNYNLLLPVSLVIIIIIIIVIIIIIIIIKVNYN